MNKKIINKKAIQKVISEYVSIYRIRPVLSVIALIAPALGSVCVFMLPPLFVGKIVDIVVINPDFTLGMVVPVVLFMAGVWLIGEVFWRIAVHALIKLESFAHKTLHERAFAFLGTRDYEFFTNNFVGSLTKKARGYTQGFETVTDQLAFWVGGSVLPFIVGMVILYQYSPLLPLMLLAWVIIVLSIAIPLIRKRAPLVMARHDTSSKLTGYISDTITNMLAVKSYAKESQEAQTYAHHVGKFLHYFERSGHYQNRRIDVVLGPLYVLTNISGILAAVYFVSALNLQASTIFIVYSYYVQVSRIFWDIKHVYRTFENAIGEASEFTEFMLEHAKISDAPDAIELRVDLGAIEFDQVGFSYHEQSKKFLSNFIVQIAPGQKVGLVGPSGGGKTTITKLLLRFLDVSEGAILIDGNNITSVTQNSLRKAIAYVPQEPLMFHRSIFDNIAYGKDGATHEDVVAAAKKAHAHEFIEALPMGYETLVGERGVKLSGGQRQRVAIARAILKNAPILVLDEATSALDSESEKYIQAGLKELMDGKTAIVIAHRLSTIKNLDRILVLKEGKIIEDGNHDTLISQNGEYAKLWAHQSGGFLEE